ncbi:MAG: hypothetical protein JXR73_02695 [Candidatus Omnitrophica bacterium]|nr:hypothetical protein [Candidatus Omnitrophota bacterium]
MIAFDRDTLRVLTMGLNDEEIDDLRELIISKEGEIYTVKNDMDLWSEARNTQFHACILGQSEELPHPTFRIWLLRGLQPNVRIIVLYDEIGSIETDPLENSEQVELIQRPADPNDLKTLFKSIESDPSCQEDLPMYDRSSKSTVESLIE